MICKVANCITDTETEYDNANCLKTDSGEYAHFQSPVTEATVVLYANSNDTYSLSTAKGYNIPITIQPTNEISTPSAQTCTIAGDTSVNPSNNLGQCTWNFDDLHNLADADYYMYVIDDAGECTDSHICSNNKSCGQIVNTSQKLYCGTLSGYLTPSAACTKWKDNPPFICDDANVYNIFKNACPSAEVEMKDTINFNCGVDVTVDDTTYNGANYNVTFTTKPPSNNTGDGGDNSLVNGTLATLGIGGVLGASAILLQHMLLPPSDI